MTPREVLDAVQIAAGKFRDFEWRLTSGASRTWYWWNEDHVDCAESSNSYAPVDGLEVTCMYCTAGGEISDRVFQSQRFTLLVLEELRQPEMERLLTDMALGIMAKIEKSEGRKELQ